MERFASGIRNAGIVFRFRLYLKERELATNITSICLHSDFLLATTLDHRLDQKYNLLKGEQKPAYYRLRIMVQKR
jgi:hypothetical protein